MTCISNILWYICPHVSASQVTSSIPDGLDDVALHAFWLGMWILHHLIQQFTILSRCQDLSATHRRAGVCQSFVFNIVFTHMCLSVTHLGTSPCFLSEV